jgi:rhodanese-related sulfurtransferase
MTINDLLSASRERLERVDPVEAPDAVRRGAVLVDIRSELQRDADGVIPGALFYPRNVLEWRIDPASGYSDPSLGGDFDKHLIVFCDEGYQSSLVAATLQVLGFPRATDLIGGFQAWRAAGLPVEPIRRAMTQVND